MMHHSLKRTLTVSFALMFSYAISNFCLANSTLPLQLPSMDYGTQDFNRAEQVSGYGNGSDYYDFPKKPPAGQGGFGGLENSLWLVPVLRYLLTVNVGSIQIEADPIVSLLPVLLQTAASWWFHEEHVMNLLQSRSENIIGEPIPINSFPVNGGDGKRSETPPAQSNKKCDSGISQSEESSRSQQYPRKRKDRRSDDDDEDLPPEKQSCSGDHYQNWTSFAELLNKAIHEEHAEEVECLLSKGAKPVARWKGEYPINVAFQLKNKVIFDILIKCMVMGGYGNDRKLNEFFVAVGSDNVEPEHVDDMAGYLFSLLQIDFQIHSLLVVFRCGLLRGVWDDYEELRQKALIKLLKKGQTLKTIFNESLKNPSCLSLKSLRWLITQGLDIDELLYKSIQQLIDHEQSLSLIPNLRRIPSKYRKRKDDSKLSLASIIEELLIRDDSKISSQLFEMLLDSAFDDYPELREIAIEKFQRAGVNIEDIRFRGLLTKAHIANAGKKSLVLLQWELKLLNIQLTNTERQEKVLKQLRNLGVVLSDLDSDMLSPVVHIAGSERCSLRALEWFLGKLGERNIQPTQEVLSCSLLAALTRPYCDPQTPVVNTREMKQTATCKIITLLNRGASFLHKSEQGYVSLSLLLQDYWDDYEVLRDYAAQEVEESKFCLEAAIVYETLLIKYVAKNLDNFSEKSFDWLINNFSDHDLLDSAELSSMLLVVLRYGLRKLDEVMIIVSSKRRYAFMYDNYQRWTDFSLDGNSEPAIVPSVELLSREANNAALIAERLLKLGASCVYTQNGEILPAVLFLADTRCDDYLNLRQLAISQINDKQIDLNLIKVGNLSLFDEMRLDSSYQGLTFSISGVHFLMMAGLIPQAIYIEPDELSFTCRMPEGVAKEINAIHEILRRKCGLRYEALQVILQSDDLEDEAALKIISEQCSACHSSDSLGLVIETVKTTIRECLRSVVLERCAEL